MDELTDPEGLGYGPSYPEGHMLEMAASGMLATTAVLFGLESFRGRGHLFGSLGRVGENPLLAVLDYLRSGARALGLGEPGAGEAAAAALADAAASDERALRLAQELAAREKLQQERIKRLVAARNRAALRREELVARHRRRTLTRGLSGWGPKAFEARLERAWRSLPAHVHHEGPFPATPAQVVEQGARSRTIYRALKESFGIGRRGEDQTPLPRLSAPLAGGAQAAPIPNFVNPFRSGTGLFGGVTLESLVPEAASIYDSSLSERLAEAVREDLAWLQGEITRRTGKQAGFSLEHRVMPGTGHTGWQLSVTVDGRSSEVWIPAASREGTFHMPDGSRPFTGKLTLLFENDLFDHGREMGLVREHRIRPVVRADELALIRLGAYTQKMKNDLLGSMQPEEVTRFVREFIVRNTFRSVSIVENSMGDMIGKASQVELQAARVFADAFRSKTVRRRLERGLHSIERLERLFETGGRYFSVDTEFISSDVAGEVGLKPGATAAGRTPYEFGGTVFETEGGRPRALASIEFRPDLFAPTSAPRTESERAFLRRLEEGIRRFQMKHAGLPKDEVDALITSLTHGRLVVHARDETGSMRRYDLLAGERPAWAPERAKGESLLAYYARVQNRMLEATRTTFSVGHNYVSSELGIFQRLFQAAGLPMHSALGEASLIDTLDIAHVLSPNALASRSLGNVSAAMLGLREREYLDVLGRVRQAGSRDDLLNMARQTGPEERLLRRFFRVLAEEADSIPGGLTLHSAASDAFITGRFTLAGLYGRLREIGMQENVRAVSELLTRLKQLGGRIDWLEEFGGGFYDEDAPGGAPGLSMNMAFTGQDHASFGTGSLLPLGILSFSALQNPVRQLYQRIKPKELLRPILPGEDDRVIDVGGRRMRLAPAAENAFGRQSAPVVMGGRVQFVESRIFGGHGAHSERGLRFRGGFEGSARQAVQMLATVLPENELWVYGSAAARTPYLMEALSSAVQARQVSHRVNLKKLQQGMDEWIEEQAQRFGIELDPVANEHARERLAQIYMLEKLYEAPEAGASSVLRKVIRRTVERHVRGLSGDDEQAARILLQAHDELRRRLPESPVVGGRAVLFRPSILTGDDLVSGEWRGPSDPEALGLDLAVRRNRKGQGEVVLTYIDTPGQTHKLMLAESIKVGAYGTVERVGAMGAQIAIPAQFEKMKRADFAGFMNIQLGRIRRQANLELQRLTRLYAGKPNFARAREEVLERTARALSELTGGQMSPAEIRRTVIQDRFADLVEFVYPDAFTRLVEGTTTGRIMNAMKAMGITLKGAFMALSAVGGDAQAGRTLMKEQLKDLAKTLEKQSLSLKTEARFREAGQVEALIGRIRRQITDIELHGGVNEDGTLFDFEWDPVRRRVMVAYQTMVGGEVMQTPVTGSSGLGDHFERATGRPTRKKRMSLLSTAILGHSATFSSGPTGPGGDVFKAWLASKAGAASMSDPHFQERLGQEIRRRGLRGGRVEWDMEEKTYLYLRPGLPPVRLETNPYTALTDLVRARVGYLGMIRGKLVGETVSGFPVGDPSRVLELSFDEGDLVKANRLTAGEVHRLYGKEARARQHERFERGRDPARLSREAIEAHRGRKVFFEPGLDPGKLFDERYDFVRARLYGSLSDDDLRAFRETLEAAGLSDASIRRLLSGAEGIERALLDEAATPAERARMRAVIEYARAGREGFARELLIPTLTGGLRPTPTPVGGALAYSLGPLHQKFVDSLEAIRTVSDAVERIHAEARRAGISKASAPERLAAFRRYVEEQTYALQGALGEVEGLFSFAVSNLGKLMVRQMRQSAGRYLGGQYKIAAPHFGLLMQQLSTLVPAFEAGEDAFRRAVAGLLYNSNYLLKENEAAFEEATERAVRSLRSYLENQLRIYGKDYHRWRGMAVGEGFIAESKAAEIFERAKEAARGYQGRPDLDTIGDGTDPMERAVRELRTLGRELRSPGSTMGFLLLRARQPDFTQWAGYEFTRATALSDDALRALGLDPEKVHALSHPISSWSAREDYDFDLNWIAAIDDPVVARFMRETKLPGAADAVVAMHRVLATARARLAGAQPDLREGPVSSGVLRAEAETMEGIAVRRLTTPLAQLGARFEDPIAAAFGYEGQALGQVKRGRQGRVAYMLQKTIVGNFGAWAKSGAVRVTQIENEFMDMMSAIVEAASKNGRVKRLFDEADTRRLRGGPRGYEFMKQTMLAVDAARREFGQEAMFDLLHMAVKAEEDITQAIAIEKYKGARAKDLAVEMDEIMRGLHARHGGKYKTFEDAIGALLSFDSSVDVRQYFARAEDLELSQDALEARLRERAVKAFRLQYDIAVSMQIAARVGLSGDYLYSTSNAAAGDLPESMRAASASAHLAGELGGVQGTVRFAQYAEDALVRRAARSGARLETLLGLQLSELSAEAAPLLRELPVGRSGVVLAGLAAVGLLAARGPDNVADGERYDLPRRPRRGTPRTTQRALELREKAAREAAYAGYEAPSVGLGHEARRPPVLRSSY